MVTPAGQHGVVCSEEEACQKKPDILRPYLISGVEDEKKSGNTLTRCQTSIPASTPFEDKDGIIKGFATTVRPDYTALAASALAAEGIEHNTARSLPTLKGEQCRIREEQDAMLSKALDTCCCQHSPALQHTSSPGRQRLPTCFRMVNMAASIMTLVFDLWTPQSA